MKLLLTTGLILSAATCQAQTAQTCWQGSVTPGAVSLLAIPCASAPTPTPLPSPSPSPPSPSGEIDPASLPGCVAALWKDNSTATLWQDESAAHNDATVRLGLQFEQPVSVRTVFLVMRHRSGLQALTALLSNSLTNGYEFLSGEYKHEGSLFDYPFEAWLGGVSYFALQSSTSPTVLNGRLWINGVQLTNPILAPKPRVMELITIETTAKVSENLLFGDRGYVNRVWDGDICGAALFNRTLSDAERDGVTARMQRRCGVGALPPLIALYGDSITYGQGDCTIDACPTTTYPQQLTQQLNTAGIVADQVEFGVGSQPSQTELDDFDKKAAPLFADCRRRQCIYVSQGSGNGLLSYSGSAGQKAAALFAVKRAIADKVHLLGGKMVITTLMPSNPTYLTPDQFDRAAFESARQAYNSLVRASPAFDAINDAGADPQIGCPTCATSNPLLPDGTHPNAAGNGILAAGALAAIRQVLGR